MHSFHLCRLKKLDMFCLNYDFAHLAVILPVRYLADPGLFMACVWQQPGKHPETENGPSQQLAFYVCSLIRVGIPPATLWDLEIAFFSRVKRELCKTADASSPTLPRHAVPCCPSCGAERPEALSRHQLASLK